jgi:L-lactate dehydrogenase complex protein LldF
VGVAEAKDLPNASTLCGACRDACPVQINIPRMLLHLRHKQAESNDENERTSSDTDKILARGFANVMSSPLLIKVGRSVGRAVSKPLARSGKIGQTRLPLISRWTQARDLPVPAERSFRDRWRDELSKGS